MAVLARKITRAKWERKEELGADEIGADAVTADLRTTGNTLSFWHCETSSTGDLKRAVLALAAGAERLDRLDVVYLEEQLVHEAGLATSATPGETPVASLRGHHVDLEKLDLNRLGVVARMVAAAHLTNATLSMTKKEVLELLVDAVVQQLVSTEDLKADIKAKVEAKLQSGK